MLAIFCLFMSGVTGVARFHFLMILFGMLAVFNMWLVFQ
jgi:hypothetical protein